MYSMFHIDTTTGQIVRGPSKAVETELAQQLVVFICKTCNRVFYSSNELNGHRIASKHFINGKTGEESEDHSDDSMSDSSHERGTVTEDALEMKLTSTSGKMRKKKKGRKVVKKSIGLRRKNKKVLCVPCNLKLNSERSFRRHWTVYHIPFDSLCSVCFKVLKTKFLLWEHENVHHVQGQDGSSGIQCPFCSKIFTRKSGTCHHIRTVHPEKKKMQCMKCTAILHSKDEMDEHGLNCRMRLKT